MTQPASKRLVTYDQGDSRYGVFYIPSASGSKHRNVILAGAKGDNATDDTAAISTAWNSGDVTVVPGGNFYFTSITVTKPGAMILGVNGSGPGVIPNAGQRSVLRRKAGSTGPAITFASGTGPVVMSGIEIDGGNQPGTLLYFADSADAVNGEETQAKFHNCYFHDTAVSDASWSDGDILYLGKGRRNARFSHCYFYNAGRNGATIWASDAQFTNCMFGPHKWGGVVLEATAGATRITQGEIYACGSAPAALAALSIAGVSVANPAVVTTTAPHGLATGMFVKIAGANGVPASVNRTYRITVLSSTTFSIPVSNTSAWTSGGTVQPEAFGVVITGSGVGCQFQSITLDRNYFAGAYMSLNSTGGQFVGCDFNSNSRFANGYSGHIEISSSGHQLVGCYFGAQTSSLPNKVANAIVTDNSSTWGDAGNVFVSSGTTTSTYTNFPAGKLLVPQGGLTFPAGSDGYVPITVKGNSGTQTADLQKWQNSSGNDLFAIDAAGHLRAAAGAGIPTAVAGAGAGTGGSVGVAISGSDTAGVITVTIGSAGAAANALAAITFAKAYTSAPNAIMLTPHSTNAQGKLSVAALASGATGWTLYSQDVPTAGAVYAFSYLIFQ